jgi:hypothetical protein
MGRIFGQDAETGRREMMTRCDDPIFFDLGISGELLDGAANRALVFIPAVARELKCRRQRFLERVTRSSRRA